MKNITKENSREKCRNSELGRFIHMAASESKFNILDYTTLILTCECPLLTDMVRVMSFSSLHCCSKKKITKIQKHTSFSHTLKSTKVSVMREPSSAIIFHSQLASLG